MAKCSRCGINTGYIGWGMPYCPNDHRKIPLRKDHTVPDIGFVEIMIEDEIT